MHFGKFLHFRSVLLILLICFTVLGNRIIYVILIIVFGYEFLCIGLSTLLALSEH